MSQSTVVERKITFLRQQKRTLTRPIQTSNRVHQIAADGGIPEKVLRDVILKGAFSLVHRKASMHIFIKVIKLNHKLQSIEMSSVMAGKCTANR